MNRIEAIRARSKFVPEPHLIIAVDGIPLDELLDEKDPPEPGFAGLAGLVSSLLGWFHNDEDGVIPWQRILPDVGCTGYAPLLICPDDLDYNCCVVVAEQDLIRWDRLGFDASRQGVVGSCIRWEPRLGSYCFSREEYECCLAAFKPHAEITAG